MVSIQGKHPYLSALAYMLVAPALACLPVIYTMKYDGDISSPSQVIERRPSQKSLDAVLIPANECLDIKGDPRTATQPSDCSL